MNEIYFKTIEKRKQNLVFFKLVMTKKYVLRLLSFQDEFEFVSRMSVTKAGIVIKITKKKTEFNASQAKKKT